MDKRRVEKISPIVELLAPKRSDDEKETMTRELRAYLAALYDWYCRLDEEGLLEPDSPVSDEGDRVRVEKTKAK